ncbi:MAG: ABC transporter substrate-binding protein, partial [Chloroflexota bacterium]|nr:ABC transporter substrate-binding protein [Chloroflexota bacterium]
MLGTADPHFVATNQEMLITRNIYSSLLKYKPNSTELAGDLATDWSVSPDGLTYTFHLRKDVDWQKGFGHFTANDVKESFDRLRDPATKSPFRGAISMLKDVQVVDDYTVKLVLSQPYAAFPQLLTDYRTGPIVNVKAVKQFGKDFNWNPVGTGPYAFQSRVPRQEVVLEANDKYYGGPPPVKKIVIKTVPDLNAEVVGVENGQYDMMLSSGPNIDPAVAKRVKSEGLGVSVFGRDNPEVLLMNVTAKPWDNLKVRQAVAYGIDRQQIIALTNPELAHPWFSPVPEGFPYVDKNLPHYDHDANKAKALLS